MINISLDLAIKAAEEIVSGREDFVYNPFGAGVCYYLPQPDLEDTDPRKHTGCLVGEILVKLGVKEAELSFAPDAKELLYFLNRKGVISIAESATWFLDCLQRRQDSGISWGEALTLGRVEVGA